MRGLTRAVTVTVILVLTGGGVWFIATRASRPKVGQGFRTYTMFRDGSGLPIGSQVVIAGVRVGEIDGLGIQDGLARISMRLRDDVVIWDDAWAAKRASSLLGDSFIEILPGGPLDDAPTDPTRRRLRSGEPVPHVLEVGSTDRVLRSLEQAMPRIDGAMIAAQRVLLDARRTVSGPLAEGFARADRWVEGGAIARPIDSAARTLAAFEEWTVGVAGSTAGLGSRVNPALDEIAVDLEGATAAIAGAQVAIHDSLEITRTRMDDIDPYLDRATAAIAEYTGSAPTAEQGTLARLINDGDLGDRIDDATAGLKSYTDGLNRTISWMGLRTEYNVLSGAPRFYVIAEITTRDDKFYVVELQKGGLGRVPEITLSDELGSDVWTERVRIDDGLRYTLQWGKRFGPARFRFGLKESMIGAGADLDLVDRRLRLSADVFESSYSRVPRLKLAASFVVFKYVSLLAGIDDALNPGGTLPISPWPAGQDVPSWLEDVRYGRDYFVGAMLNITDADLAAMLRVYGALLIAGLAPAP